MHQEPWFARDFEDLCLHALPWDRLRGKRIMVTGGTGFIARYFIRMLFALNERYQLQMQIYAVCRNGKKAREQWEGYENNPALHLLVCGICSAFLEGQPPMDVVFHMASPANRTDYLSDPSGAVDANIIATRYLLECAARDHTVLFYMSSGAVYEDTPEKRREEDAICARKPILSQSAIYASCKLFGERLCLCYAEQKKAAIRILRPFAVFGPGEKRGSGRGVMEFLECALAQRPIRLRSRGADVREYCYVLDVVSAMLYILFYGENDAYNVGNPNSIASILELATEFARDLPEQCSPRVIVPDQAEGLQEPDVYIADTSKLQALGWQPVIDLREGVARMIASYRDAGEQ